MKLSLYSTIANVTATRVARESLVEIADWCDGEALEGRYIRLFEFRKGQYVHAYIGDWIITDESGEFIILKDDDFKSLYSEFVVPEQTLNQALHLAMLMHREAPLATYSGRTWQDMPLKHRERQVEAARKILKALSEGTHNV